MSLVRSHIMVCGGTGCTSSGSKMIIEKFNHELEKYDLQSEVEIIRTGCFGLCELGPIVIVYPSGVFYTRINEMDIEEIVAEHLLKGKIVKRLVYQETILEDGSIKSFNETKFYSKQERIVLEKCGLIDPENINEYIALDGYFALEKVVTQMKPIDVINEILESGLRGRGGGGFPTGTKWKFAYDQEADQKYVVCNADEGDPGAFMDRSILEGDPNSVVEAMAIAGYAIGASEGYVYVRAEYPIAVERLQVAIDQARAKGLLGEKIFGTDFAFDVKIRLGAGAFVCGEETALLESIEGRRGEPRLRPPFPAVKGLYGKPTITNNVETFSNIPKIILKGANWFKNIGAEKSTGTKIFAVGGKVELTGLVEVPMGTTVREVVYDICGGIPKGKAFKAVQTGGPSGGCIPLDLIDTPIEFDTLISIGSMMGSGGMIVMDEDNCMVDIAKFFLEFTCDESCGKCAPCRIGTVRMKEMLEKFTSGKAEIKDIDSLLSLALSIKSTAICGLGQTAPNPVISTIRYFRDEYVAHARDKKCPAGVCKDLINYYIDEEKCVGCTACSRVCPASAISGNVKETHKIDINVCIKCGACIEKCQKFKAIYTQ
ncbi:MAG: NADH-quinone oxidoreductase subunit NuoF [Lachnospirales bacterium]